MTSVAIAPWLAGSALGVALLAAFAAVLLGRSLTGSIGAAIVSLLALTIALLALGAGFVALITISCGALGLAAIQLYGWMLVDIDRDHLPPTDAATRLARSLAFLLLGGGLGLLLAGIALQGGFPEAAGALTEAGPRAIGERLFGGAGELATLLGLTIAGALLATLMLSMDEGADR